MDSLRTVVESVFVSVRVVDVGSCLSGFFFRLKGELLFVFDLFLFYLLVEVAPVAAGDDELVDLELWMNTLRPIEQVSVEGILCGEPDAGQTVSVLPLHALQALL
jgi:hypothetical protein